jgi:hypothetical protein
MGNEEMSLFLLRYHGDFFLEQDACDTFVVKRHMFLGAYQPGIDKSGAGG